MWDLDHIEGWMLKNSCFWTAALEKTLESLLDSKQIKPVNPKWDQPGHSLKGLMLKLKHQYFGHLMCRANSLEKSLMLGKIENRRRGGGRWWDGWMASSTLWTWAWANPGWDNEGQGNLSCCIPWGHKKLDMTEWLTTTFIFWQGLITQVFLFSYQRCLWLCLWVALPCSHYL